MDSKQIELSGHVSLDHVDTGSKSERTAVILHGEDGTTYVLRKQGGPAFGDGSLDELVGADLTIQGVALGNTLFMKGWQRRQ